MPLGHADSDVISQAIYYNNDFYFATANQKVEFWYTEGKATKCDFERQYDDMKKHVQNLCEVEEDGMA